MHKSNRGTVMKKIMFNDRFLLTQAVLDGRKTQTRRVINPQPEYDNDKGMLWKGVYSGIGFDNPKDAYKNFSHHSKYKTSEVLCVAMSYESIYLRVGSWEYVEEYKDKHENLAGWKNKMFTDTKMPYAKVIITDVRVQRLQDITDEECLLEGLGKEQRKDGGYNYIFFDAKRDLYIRERTPRDAYARLIDAISGKGTWESNPYVFVYDFELVK